MIKRKKIRLDMEIRITCNICSVEIGKSYLSKHKKTKKCLSEFYKNKIVEANLKPYKIAGYDTTHLGCYIDYFFKKTEKHALIQYYPYYYDNGLATFETTTYLPEYFLNIFRYIYQKPSEKGKIPASIQLEIFIHKVKNDDNFLHMCAGLHSLDGSNSLHKFLDTILGVYYE